MEEEKQRREVPWGPAHEGTCDLHKLVDIWTVIVIVDLVDPGGHLSGHTGG